MEKLNAKHSAHVNIVIKKKSSIFSDLVIKSEWMSIAADCHVIESFECDPNRPSQSQLIYGKQIFALTATE